MNLARLFVKAITPIVSMFLILIGIIQLRAQVWTIGAICILLAMAGFVLGIRLLENTPFTAEEFEFLRPYLTPAILWTIVISLLTLSIFYVSDNLKSPETDRIAAVAWVSSVILGIFTIGWKRSQSNDRQTLLEKIRANRTELIILLIVLILALALRTIDLSTHPYPWSGDEASIGSEAMHILSGETTNLFDTGWSSQPNWSFVPTAVSELIFGENILAVRLPSALAGTLAVFFVYLAAA